MAIQVIDRRNVRIVNAQVEEVSPMVKVIENGVKRIQAKAQVVSNPKQEVKQMEKTYTLAQVRVMVQEAYNRGLSEKEVVPTRHKEVAPIRVKVETQKVVEEKPKADMHEAGFKAIVTRMVNYIHKRPQEVRHAFVNAKVGEIRKVVVDKGLPTEKFLKMRLDKVEGRLCSFTLKVETKAGPRYAKIAFQF